MKECTCLVFQHKRELIRARKTSHKCLLLQERSGPHSVSDLCRLFVLSFVFTALLL